LEEPVLRALLIVTVVTIVGQACAQTPTGTLIIYRPRGASFGFIHYSEGEHPTFSCNGVDVARMAESRKATVSAPEGTYRCVATEKQYPGELNATSDEVSIVVKPNGTIYLRLEIHVGHVHFVLREVSADVGSVETGKLRPIKDSDSYRTVLAANEEKQLAR
jgi:hypothetical protein